MIRILRHASLAGIGLLVACSGSSAPDGTGGGSGFPPPASYVAVPYVSAHRGGAAYAPENTMPAYENAARMGVDDFETDLLRTADDVLVLMHDDTLDRTTDCSGAVADISYADLLECDAAYWFSPGQPTTRPDEMLAHPLRGTGVQVPTAAELFAYAATFSGVYAPTVTIEVKISFDSLGGVTVDGLKTAQLLVGEIHASGIADRIIVQSFNPLAIQLIKLLDPSIRTLYLTPVGATLSLAVAAVGLHEIIAPEFGSPDLNALTVQLAQGLGKQVVPWTADSNAEIQSLIDIGVDGIITNYPACLLALQGRLASNRVLPPQVAGDDVAHCRE
ncbi:MAG: hypothetical protein M3O62_00995 [Pseudomonadota bacterium]|nr:hypothetical protein [Pseudomonadota bacterium]